MTYIAREKITMKVRGELIEINPGEVLNLTVDQAAKLGGKIVAEDAALARRGEVAPKGPESEQGTIVPKETPPPEPLGSINRQWTPSWPYTCQCGEPTGFTTNGVGICPSCEFGPNDPPETIVSTRSKKKQVPCRAFKVTGIHAVTSVKHCLDRQGPHCGKCELRQTESTKGVKE